MSTKANVLELLERQNGQSLSGESIAGTLNISRNAVWKAIQSLRADGYRITAATNKGYCLELDYHMVSSAGMTPFLAKGWDPARIHVHQSLESTNKTAKEMAIAGASHGTVVIAGCQTGGKGRYNRVFHSPSGGLYMSFIMHPDHLRFENTTLVIAFAAVTVCKAIEMVCQKQPRIKWVNDIYLDGAKICGILTEAVTDFESGGLQWIVIGIGVNFSTGPEDFPAGLRGIAGSIYSEGGTVATKNRLAAELINSMAGVSEQEERNVLGEYRQRLILGKKVLVQQKGRAEYEAVATDINSMGNLLVRDRDGQLIALQSGEVSIIQAQDQAGLST